LKPVTPPITKLKLNNQGGFSEPIEIKILAEDPPDESSHCVFKPVKSKLYVDQDEFFNGNEFFSISQNDELKKDDKIEVTHYEFQKHTQNYMS
jgi:hypothetical protein